jgi:hypothetical protein
MSVIKITMEPINITGGKSWITTVMNKEVVRNDVKGFA